MNDEISDKELSNFSAHTEFDVSLKTEKMSNFDDVEWIAQGFLFFGAGFDTSADLLQMTCYELAVNRDSVQSDLIAEIDQTLNALDGSDISYEMLHKMKFLDMVISESLRKWPPAAQTERCCNKDYNLDLENGSSVKIRKGQVVFVPIYQIHHDPEFFSEPEKFDPYRFSEENKNQIASGTYLPFGVGPRSCLASRFALMSAKLVIFKLLSKFTIDVCDKTPKKMTYQPNLTFKLNETIYLNFVPRVIFF